MLHGYKNSGVLRDIADWLIAWFFLTVVFIYWFGFSLLKSPVLVPVFTISLFKEKSVVLGKTINWKSWAKNMFIGDDQNANTVLGGDRDISVSSRVGYNATRGNSIALKMEVVIDRIFFWQNGHCRISIEKDEAHNKNWGGH